MRIFHKHIFDFVKCNASRTISDGYHQQEKCGALGKFRRRNCLENNHQTYTLTITKNLKFKDTNLISCAFFGCDLKTSKWWRKKKQINCFINLIKCTFPCFHLLIVVLFLRFFICINFDLFLIITCLYLYLLHFLLSSNL